MLPPKDRKIVKSKFIDWKFLNSKDSIPIETHYMDFGKKATVSSKLVLLTLFTNFKHIIGICKNIF